MKNLKYLLAVVFLIQFYYLSAQSNMTEAEFDYDGELFTVKRYDDFFSIRRIRSSTEPKILPNPTSIDSIPVEEVIPLVKVTGVNGWKPLVRELGNWDQLVGRGEYIIAHFICDSEGRILDLSFSTKKTTNFRNTNFGLLYKKIKTQVKLNLESPNNMHKKLNHFNFGSIYNID